MISSWLEGAAKIGNASNFLKDLQRNWQARTSPSKVGNFDNLQNTNFKDVLTRIPSNAKQRILKPQSGKVTEGVEFTWTTTEGTKMTVRVHGPDPSASLGSNAAKGWIVRVQQGRKYWDPLSKEFQPPGIANPRSNFYNEKLINNTHIPIQTPRKWRNILDQNRK